MDHRMDSGGTQGACLQNWEVIQGHTYVTGDLPGGFGSLDRHGIQPYVAAHLHFIPIFTVNFLKGAKNKVSFQILLITPRAQVELISEGYNFEVPEPVKEREVGERIILQHCIEIGNPVWSSKTHPGLTRVLSFSFESQPWIELFMVYVKAASCIGSFGISLCRH